MVSLAPLWTARIFIFVSQETNAMSVYWNCLKQVFLAADGQDGNGLQFEKFGPAKPFKKLFPRVLKKSILMALVCFLFSPDKGYIFLQIFKDNVAHGFSCLPLILG